MKLGAILVQTGVISAEQLDAALRQQVVYGGRLGSNLIELGSADIDAIAHGLARQHRVPAALTRHFDHRDPQVVALLDRTLAGQHMAMPIAWANMVGGRQLVVCMRDPADLEARAALERATGQKIIASVAPELVLAFWVERCYGVPRPARLAMARAGGADPIPATASQRIVTLPDEGVDIDIDEEVGMPGQFELVALDDGQVERDDSQFGFDPRNPSSPLPPRVNPTVAPSPAPSTPPPPSHPSPSGGREPAPTLDLATARARLATCSDRDQVTAVLADFMRGAFPVGLILVARSDLALGQAGFGGSFDAASVESIVVPLGSPSLFKTARDAGRTFRGPPPAEGKAVQERFFKLFPGKPPADVAVVPVLVRDRPVCLCYVHGAGGGRLDDAAVTALGVLAGAAGDAFTRLIKARRETGKP